MVAAHAEGRVLSRVGTLLPAVQFLQKSIQRHWDDISKLYVSWEWLMGRVGLPLSPAGSGWFHARAALCVV